MAVITGRCTPTGGVDRPETALAAGRYADWAAGHHEPHFAGPPDGADLAAGFDEAYRAAVPDDHPDTLVAALGL